MYDLADKLNSFFYYDSLCVGNCYDMLLTFLNIGIAISVRLSRKFLEVNIEAKRLRFTNICSNSETLNCRQIDLQKECSHLG